MQSSQPDIVISHGFTSAFVRRTNDWRENMGILFGTGYRRRRDLQPSIAFMRTEALSNIRDILDDLELRVRESELKLPKDGLFSPNRRIARILKSIRKQADRGIRFT